MTAVEEEIAGATGVTPATFLHGLRRRGPLFAGIALAEAACLAIVLWRGAPATLVAPSSTPPVATLAAGTLPAPAAAVPEPDGWITVTAPADLDVRIDGVLRAEGRSSTRVALSPGRHEVQMSDTATGFRQSVVVTIVAGQGVALEPRIIAPRHN